MPAIKLKFGVVATDEHVQETPDLWTSRLSKKTFGDDIPHLGEMPDGTQQWFFRGNPQGPRIASGGVATTPVRVEPRRWEQVNPTTYDPAARLKIMDADMVDTHTLFPDIAGIANNNFQKEGPEEFRLACIRAYNDWMIEHWVDHSPRYIAQCIAPMWDVKLAIAEMDRAVQRGHKALVWHGAPEVLGLPFFNDPQWFPLYARVEELGIPMCLHLGAVPVLPAWPGYAPQMARAVIAVRSISSQIQVMTNVLFSGILDRFPKLKLISVESGVGWIPYLLETADHTYDTFRTYAGDLSRPSDAFRRNCYANFWFEQFGIQNRDAIGVDRILYETDFPHPTSTWPDSVACREASLKGVTPKERKMLLMDNAIKVYNLDVDVSALGPS